MRLRVIYADLSELIGVAEQWGEVRDGVLFVQIERTHGHWVTLLGLDHYFVDGARFGGYTDWVEWVDATRLIHDTPPPGVPLATIRHGKLVDNDIWMRASAMARELPEVLR